MRLPLLLFETALWRRGRRECSSPFTLRANKPIHGFNGINTDTHVHTYTQVALELSTRQRYDDDSLGGVLYVYMQHV